jgi:hypothetical protein
MGSKKVVLKLRSVSSIVIAPASTGKDSSRSTEVTRIAQTYKGSRESFTPCGRIFTIVVRKLIAPRIDEIPAR